MHTCTSMHFRIINPSHNVEVFIGDARQGSVRLILCEATGVIDGYLREALLKLLTRKDKRKGLSKQGLDSSVGRVSMWSTCLDGIGTEERKGESRDAGKKGSQHQ